MISVSLLFFSQTWDWLPSEYGQLPCLSLSLSNLYHLPRPDPHGRRLGAEFEGDGTNISLTNFADQIFERPFQGKISIFTSKISDDLLFKSSTVFRLSFACLCRL